MAWPFLAFYGSTQRMADLLEIFLLALKVEACGSTYKRAVTRRYKFRQTQVLTDNESTLVKLMSLFKTEYPARVLY